VEVLFLPPVSKKKRAKEPVGIRKVRKMLKDNPETTMKELMDEFDQTEAWVKYRLQIIQERNPELFGEEGDRPKAGPRKPSVPVIVEGWEIVQSLCRKCRLNTAHYLVFGDIDARNSQCLSCGKYNDLVSLKVETEEAEPETDRDRSGSPRKEPKATPEKKEERREDEREKEPEKKKPAKKDKKPATETPPPADDEPSIFDIDVEEEAVEGQPSILDF